MEKDNKNTKLNDTDKKLHISDVSSSVYYISDDLEDLKRRYTPEQLQKMWEEAYPKSSEISGKVIITGTPK